MSEPGDEQQPGGEENQIIAERRAKLHALRERGPAFPNDFQRDALAATLHEAHDGKTADALEAAPVGVAVAGRMVLKRVMGKASFATLQDMSGRIQLYITSDALGAAAHDAFKHWDLGDIVGARGTLFKTRTGELSVRVTDLRLLAKALRPLPEKFHGLTNQEQKYRQRYVDLITSSDSRRVFIARSQIVQAIREFFVGRGYLEVETPMMHPIPGARRHDRLSPITTRSTPSYTFGSPRSFISSGWSWAGWRRYSKSTAIFATRAFQRGTTPNSPCSSSTRHTGITAT